MVIIKSSPPDDNFYYDFVIEEGESNEDALKRAGELLNPLKYFIQDGSEGMAITNPDWVDEDGRKVGFTVIFINRKLIKERLPFRNDKLALDYIIDHEMGHARDKYFRIPHSQKDIITRLTPRHEKLRREVFADTHGIMTCIVSGKYSQEDMADFLGMLIDKRNHCRASHRGTRKVLKAMRRDLDKLYDEFAACPEEEKWKLRDQKVVQYADENRAYALEIWKADGLEFAHRLRAFGKALTRAIKKPKQLPRPTSKPRP